MSHFYEMGCLLKFQHCIMCFIFSKQWSLPPYNIIDDFKTITSNAKFKNDTNLTLYFDHPTKCCPTLPQELKPATVVSLTHLALKRNKTTQRY